MTGTLLAHAVRTPPPAQPAQPAPPGGLVEGLRVLVLGGRGSGALARRLLAEGATVAVADRVADAASVLAGHDRLDLLVVAGPVGEGTDGPTTAAEATTVLADLLAASPEPTVVVADAADRAGDPTARDGSREGLRRRLAPTGVRLLDVREAGSGVDVGSLAPAELAALVLLLVTAGPPPWPGPPSTPGRTP